MKNTQLVIWLYIVWLFHLADYLGFSVEHIKVNLDEIQSLDLKDIVENKVRKA